MNSLAAEQICPKCHFPRVKSWDDLTDEQQFLAQRLPASAKYTVEERKKHRYCERCWFEDSMSEKMNI